MHIMEGLIGLYRPRYFIGNCTVNPTWMVSQIIIVINIVIIYHLLSKKGEHAVKFTQTKKYTKILHWRFLLY